MAAPGATTLRTHTRTDLRDAVEAVYTKDCAVSAVSARFNGVERRRVTELAAQLPPGLLNNATQLTLRRAANAVAGVKEKRVYTQSEARAALGAVTGLAAERLTYTEAAAKYGIRTRTLERFVSALHAKRLAATPAMPALLAADVAAFEFVPTGAPPLLPPVESALVLAKAASGAEVGAGSGRKAVCEAARAVAQAVAASLPPGSAAAQRLQHAVFSPGWHRRATSSAAAAELVTVKEVKASNLSQTRAAASATGLNAAMFAKFSAHDAELYAAGILKTPHPEADQVFDGDEVGRNPTGALCIARACAHARSLSRSPTC
jgi:hypothetical protein